MADLVEAVKSGRLESVRAVLAHEVAVDARDEDGWTALTLAADDGRLDLIELLLAQHADVNYPNLWGETALSRAVFAGNVKAVRLLMNNDADVDLADEDGDTPLHVAVIRKQLGLARFLLRVNADVNATNGAGMTAQAMAYQYGLRDFVELLQTHQEGQRAVGRLWRTARGLGGWVYQLVGVPTLNEPEEEISEDIDKAVALEQDAGDSDYESYETSRSESPKEESTNGESVTTLLPALLELCAGMVETRSICEDVLERLQRVQCLLDEQDNYSSRRAGLSLRMITKRFQSFLLQYTAQSSLERLAGTRTILELLKGFHHDIEDLEVTTFPTALASVSIDWKERWEDAVEAVEKRLVASWETNWSDLSRELPDTESQSDALLLLSFETSRHKARYSGRSRDLFESVARKVARMSGAPIPEIPPWFVPRHEVQRQPKPFASGAFGKVYRGVWQGSKVVIKCVKVNSTADRKAFRREATIWHRLRHPHIVNFFGACHQSQPCFFICEEAANGNLVDYLDKMKAEGRSLIWKKLHEAALGLLYLHQNNTIHGDLKCNQILVGGDGKAMLTDFGFSFVSSESKPTNAGGAIRWRAPECLESNYQSPTFESDVYSFGMCVIEAVTYNVPWGIYLPDRAVIDCLQHGTFLPRPQQFEKDEEWEFVLGLCAFEPSRRVKLLDVIETLKKFANEPMDQGRPLQVALLEDAHVTEHRLSKKASLDLLKEARAKQIYQAERRVFSVVIGFFARRRYLLFLRAVRTMQLMFQYKRTRKRRHQNVLTLRSESARKVVFFLRMALQRLRFLRLCRVVRLLQCRFRYRCLVQTGKTYLSSVQSSKRRQRRICFAESHSILGSSPSVASFDNTDWYSQTQSLPSTVTKSQRNGPTSASENTEANAPVWVDDEDCFNCYVCSKDFTMFRRKHHCRVCFKIICNNCSLTHKKRRACVVCAGLRSAGKRSGTKSNSEGYRGRGGKFWDLLTSNRRNNQNTASSGRADDGTMALSSDVGVSRSETHGLWNDNNIIAVRISRDSVDIGAKISRGAFGEVYTGTVNGMRVAVKTLLPELRRNMTSINEFLGEAKIMATLEHPCIVNLIGVAWDSLSDVCMIVEYMDGGDLRSLLDQYKASARPVGFNVDKTRIALNICHALTYLHSLAAPLIHRDLKSRNVLLDQALNAKVTDFGISRQREIVTMTAGVGTSLWMAPEVVMGERYNEKADIFSFGVVLSELDVHSIPYEGSKGPALQVIRKVLTGALRVDFSDSYPPSVAELGNACVSLDPDERPTAAEALYKLQLILQTLGDTKCSS